MKPRPVLSRLAWTAVLFLSPIATSAQSEAASAFYYLWYGNPEHDGRFMHWSHSVLPHWTEEVRRQYPNASFIAPDDIHAPFYPERGLYSSSDPTVLLAHMRQLKSAGIGVAVASWWGRPGVSAGDSQGIITDAIFPALLEAALTAGVQVAFHLEPYAGRSAASIRDDVAYVISQYGSHPALFRLRRQRSDSSGACLPVFYVYDSYHIPARDWAALLGGIRGDPALDGFFIGLWLEARHGAELADGGFDGAYSYFATDGFSYGSSRRNWSAMAALCSDRRLLWVPSVAPGYDDSKIRPWNRHNTVPRSLEGYRGAWAAALASGAAAISVTSFNEFGEGTQIEPVVARTVDVDALAPLGRALDWPIRRALGIGAEFPPYEGGPDAYLHATATAAAELRRCWDSGAFAKDAAAGAFSGCATPHAAVPADSTSQADARVEAEQAPGLVSCGQASTAPSRLEDAEL